MEDYTDQHCPQRKNSDIVANRYGCRSGKDSCLPVICNRNLGHSQRSHKYTSIIRRTLPPKVDAGATHINALVSIDTPLVHSCKHCQCVTYTRKTATLLAQ